MLVPLSPQVLGKLQEFCHKNKIGSKVDFPSISRKRKQVGLGRRDQQTPQSSNQEGSSSWAQTGRKMLPQAPGQFVRPSGHLPALSSRMSHHRRLLFSIQNRKAKLLLRLSSVSGACPRSHISAKREKDDQRMDTLRRPLKHL